MNAADPVRAPAGFLAQLRAAGIEPGDSAELQLAKSLLLLATGLVTAAIMVWVGLYQLLGLRFSSTLPVAFQLLLVGNMLLFFRTRNFEFFRTSQLGLFLFLPFVAQWTAGNVVTTSGVALWSVLAPVGAMLCGGVRQSIGWFVAWLVLTAMSGGVDYYLADPVLVQKAAVPLRVSLLFFVLNFISIVALIYALLFFAIERKRRIEERFERSRLAVEGARDVVERMML
jgi:adenylate cyclase